VLRNSLIIVDTLWAWVVVAGLGALHGLNPATGWAFAAAGAVRARDPRQALRALVPIAVGHTLSVALVAGAVWASVTLGPSIDLALLQSVAVGLLATLIVACLAGRTQGRRGATAGQAALGLWSFGMSTAHGAGLMLVPALTSLCLSDTPAREITASGSFTLALAAVGVHTAAMLAVTAVMASGACRLLQALALKRHHVAIADQVRKFIHGDARPGQRL
jgi:hypothetical protein